MAKEEKTKVKGKTKVKAEKKAATPEFKYGVQELADELEIEPASVRVQLRNKNITKAGKSYGWNSESEFKSVVKQLKEKAEKPAKSEKKAEKKTTKAVVKKAEKKAA